MSITRKAKKAAKKTADPMAEAFAIAEALAPAGIRDWLINGYDCSEKRGEDTTAVYDALVRRRCEGGLDPQAVINRTLEQVTDQRLQFDALEASTGLLVTALDAGYLYGLAVGLAFAKMGGAR